MRFEPRPAIFQDQARLGVLQASAAAARMVGLVSGSATDVMAVFPELSATSARRVAASSASHAPVQAVLRRLCRWSGYRWLERVVEVEGLAVLARLQGRPIIAVSWHAGFIAAAPAGLARAGLGGLLLRYDRGPPGSPFGFEHVSVGSEPWRRALALAQSLTALRRGGTVLVIAGLSAAQPTHHLHPVSLLGRQSFVGAGIAVLARLTGAAIVPLECSLAADRVRVSAHEPITPGRCDAHTTQRLVDFFEPRLAARPGSLWPDELRLLARAPRQLLA